MRVNKSYNSKKELWLNQPPQIWAIKIVRDKPARQDIADQVVVISKKLMAELQNIPIVSAELREALKHA